MDLKSLLDFCFNFIFEWRLGIRKFILFIFLVKLGNLIWIGAYDTTLIFLVSIFL